MTTTFRKYRFNIIVVGILLYGFLDDCSAQQDGSSASNDPVYVTLHSGDVFMLRSWERLDDGSIKGKGARKAPLGSEYAWIPFTGVLLFEDIASMSGGGPSENLVASGIPSSLSVHAGLLWSPSVEMNLPVPLNTLYLGAQTEALPFDLGLAVTYTFGSFSGKTKTSDIPSVTNLNIENNNQLSILFLLGTHARGSVMELGLSGLIGYVSSTQIALGTSVDLSPGDSPLSIDESSGISALGYGARLHVALRLDEQSSFGIGAQLLSSKLGTLASFGVAVSYDLGLWSRPQPQ